MTRTRTFLCLLLAASSGCGRNQGGDPPPTPTPATYAQKLLSSLDKGSIERTRSDMSATRTAIMAYTAEEGRQPDAGDFATLGSLIAPAYIRTVPQKDAWGMTYVFERQADGWRLIAPGADGAAGTGDDIVLSDAGFEKLPDGYKNLL